MTAFRPGQRPPLVGQLVARAMSGGRQPQSAEEVRTLAHRALEDWPPVHDWVHVISQCLPEIRDYQPDIDRRVEEAVEQCWTVMPGHWEHWKINRRCLGADLPMAAMLAAPAKAAYDVVYVAVLEIVTDEVCRALGVAYAEPTRL